MLLDILDAVVYDALVSFGVSCVTGLEEEVDGLVDGGWWMVDFFVDSGFFLVDSGWWIVDGG